jgi:hypothetical protein
MKERKNHMKKLNTLLVIIVGIIVFFVFPAFADTYQHNYTQICNVYSVEGNTTLFIDPCGYLWEVNDNNYVEGETVKVYFHDNFTETTRKDDIIKKVKRVD